MRAPVAEAGPPLPGDLGRHRGRLSEGVAAEDAVGGQNVMAQRDAVVAVADVVPVVAEGRAAVPEAVLLVRLRQDLEVWRGAQPLLVERNVLEAGSTAMSSAWGLAGRGALGTLLAYPAEEHLLAAARAVLAGFESGHAGATEIDGVLACRALGRDGRPLRRNTPTLYNVGWRARLFWDGRAADLETQALGPLLSPDEMG